MTQITPFDLWEGFWTLVCFFKWLEMTNYLYSWYHWIWNLPINNLPTSVKIWDVGKVKLQNLNLDLRLPMMKNKQLVKKKKWKRGQFVGLSRSDQAIFDANRQLIDLILVFFCYILLVLSLFSTTVYEAKVKFPEQFVVRGGTTQLRV